MNVETYRVGDTLVIILGNLMFDPYQGQQKHFDVQNKIFGHIVVHLASDTPTSNYALTREISQAINCCDFTDHDLRYKSLQTPTRVTYYLHGNWDIPDLKNRHVVRNCVTTYNLDHITPFITAMRRTVNGLAVYMYDYNPQLGASCEFL